MKKNEAITRLREIKFLPLLFCTKEVIQMDTSLIQEGDLIFIKGKGIIQEAIEDISHSPYSHCAILIKTNELIEAQFGRKTGWQALDIYKDVSDVYRCDEMTEEQRKIVIDYVVSCIGEKYSVKLILWEGLHYVFHIDCPMEEEHEHDCSQLIVDGFRRANLDPNANLRYLSPGDLAKSNLLRYVGSF